MMTSRRIEIGIAACALLLVAGLGHVLRQVDHKVGLDNLVENYVMPRPKALFSALFSLDGREIQRKHVNPFAKKDSEAAKAPVAKLDGPKPGASPKKAKASNKSKSENKSAEVSMQVVEETAGTLTGFDGLGAGAVVSDRAPQSPVTQALQDQPENNGSKEELAPSQWRALLLAQPTEENINKFIQAYGSGAVTAQDFYQISSELLASNKTEVQALGLKAIAAFPSLRSFKVLVGFESQADASLDAEVAKAFKSYEQSSRSGVLFAALASQETAVVSRAIEISVNSFQVARSGSQAGRGERGQSEFVINSYARFVPVFQSLAQSSDGVIAQNAAEALSLFQVVAAN